MSIGRGDRILLCWYSGTGNTLLVVNAMKDVFEKAGVETNLLEIKRDSRVSLNSGVILGVAFPVAYQSTYPFVWNFLRNLPEADGNKVFMVDTLAGFSGGIVGPLRRLLQGKGYDPVGAREIRMPMNFLIHGNPERNRRQISRGISDAAGYAENLLNGKTRWGRVPVLPELMLVCHYAALGLLFSKWNQRKFGIRNDPAACTGCGICAGECPAGNIEMLDRGDGRLFPDFGLECEFCLRCLASCPEEANTFVLNKGPNYRAKDFLD